MKRHFLLLTLFLLIICLSNAQEKKPKVALVLSGGGMKAAAFHIGVALSNTV